MADESVIIPLHPKFDRALASLDQLGVSNAYVVRCTGDPTALLTDISLAFDRVAEKWRFLAGRVEWSKKDEMWCIKAPLGPLPSGYKTHQLTHTIAKEPNRWTNHEPWSSETAATFEFLPDSFFRHSTTKMRMAQFLGKDAPMLSLHATTTNARLILSIVFPHAILDGIGMGTIIRFLSCELNGKEWTPPPLLSTNLLSAALDELTEKVPKPLKTVTFRDQVPANLTSTLNFFASVAYEFLWERCSFRNIYIGERILARIVSEAREEMKKEKGEDAFISEGDIYVAWLLKHTFLHTNTRPDIIVNATSVFTMRPLLSANTSLDLSTYVHNSNWAFELDSLTVKSMRELPLWKIAQLHRSSLDTTREPSELVASYQSALSIGARLPLRGWGTSNWMFSNQIRAGMPNLDLGIDNEVEEFWSQGYPFVPDHIFAINRLKGGVIFAGSVRKSEWKSIEKELERLRSEV